MNIIKVLRGFSHSSGGKIPVHRKAIFLKHSVMLGHAQRFSTFSDEAELEEFLGYMDNLKNYEKCGVPKGAGTDTDDGFDLGRMRRLMQLLGNPHYKFKVNFSHFLVPLLLNCIHILLNLYKNMCNFLLFLCVLLTGLR